MALKSLSVHYTKIINDDRVPLDFDIVRKEDREKKCIACYINGFYLKNNLDLWKLHKNGQNVYKTLSKKRYKDYLKGVYIELCKGPDNTGDYLERSNHILNRLLECMRLENKENIQVFVISPLCRMLCSYGDACTKLELLRKRVCCESCLYVYFSIEETQALNDFCHTFSNIVHLMSRLCMVCVIVQIIFGYYMDKYLDGICIKNEKKKKKLTIQPTWIPIRTVHTIHAHTFVFYFILFLNSNNCVVVEGIKTQHV